MPRCLRSRAINWANLARKEKKEKKLAITVFSFPPDKGNVGTAAYLNVSGRGRGQAAACCAAACMHRAAQLQQRSAGHRAFYLPATAASACCTRCAGHSPLTASPVEPTLPSTPSLLQVFGSIYRVLKDLQRDGYDVGQLPMNEEALIKSVLTQVRRQLCNRCACRCCY